MQKAESGMDITYLELPAKDLRLQKEYYSNVLGLPVELSTGKLGVKVGCTVLVFTQADADFDGAYHFAFNIPENQFQASKEWIASRVLLLKDTEGRDEFTSESWNSHSIYFKDAAGNILEFIARHNLKNAVVGDFTSDQILNVSEIGLPSDDVVAFANELFAKLDLSVFMQEPDKTFMPVGDDNGLFILPVKDRIWFPNTGVPAKLLPVKMKAGINGKRWEVHGFPYFIQLLS
jgi:catechol 2,3-dioxygenase-like lactoylglutathione lyase family enzyme